MNTKTFLFFFLCFFIIAVHAQTNIQIPKEYKLTEIPNENSAFHRKLNGSKDMSIKLVKDSIATFNTPDRQNSELEFNDGLLIGSNHGEWGGKLTYTLDGKETLIKEGTIFNIFKLNDQYYFIEGIAHGIFDEGAIYKLDYKNEKFSYQKIVDLPDSPEAFQLVNDKIYIATFNHFVIIQNFKIITKIEGFWFSLYPNSLIIVNENHIFMGIRGGIVELFLNEQPLKFYTYQE